MPAQVRRGNKIADDRTVRQVVVVEVHVRPSGEVPEWCPSSRRIASFGTPRRNMIDAHECRNVCSPTGHSIPARSPAARTTR